MNRCVVLSLALLASTFAQAQTALRSFPAQALRAEMQVVLPPEIMLDGRPERLAPGARIRGTSNLLQMSGSLVGQLHLVHFTRDPSGQVMDVWILNAAEAAREPWPRTPQQAAKWRFDAAAQTWSKP